MEIIPFDEWIHSQGGCQCDECDKDCNPHNCLYLGIAYNLYLDALKEDKGKYNSIMEHKCLV